MFVFEKKLKNVNNHHRERHQNLGGTSSNIDKFMQ